jgi:hypothetical protein
MERRAFLQLLCVGMGIVLTTKPTKAITLVAPPLTQTDSGSGPTPEPRRQVGRHGPCASREGLLWPLASR